MEPISGFEQQSSTVSTLSLLYVHNMDQKQWKKGDLIVKDMWSRLAFNKIKDLIKKAEMAGQIKDKT